jgi:hypothetical protein
VLRTGAKISHASAYFSAWIVAANPSLSSCSDDPPVIDLTLSDEDTTEHPPCPPLIEFLITDECAKVRLSEEIPAEVFGAHVCHHLSGHREFRPFTCVVYGYVPLDISEGTFP